MSSGKTYTVNPTCHTAYPDTNGIEATDGLMGGLELANAKYFAWNSQNPSVRIDLSESIDLSYVRFNFMNNNTPIIFAPNQLVVYGSNDDSNWNALGTFVKATDWTNDAGPSNNWSNNLSVEGSYRYVKLSFSYQTGWIFLSEIEIYGLL
jgi:hypothetical protein